jgi:hypothetical protein
MTNKLAEHRAQDQFANETSSQQAKHHEIEQRYKGRTPGPQWKLIINLRKAEIERLVALRCGETLPDDDAGRDYLRVVADHLVRLGANYVMAWAARWAPWSDSELDHVIEHAGRRWNKEALGRELNLKNDECKRLRIRTIAPVDRTRAQRAEDRRAQQAAAAKARRLKAGAKPHATSLAQTKPWLDLGISESTYRRRKRHDRNSSPIFLESLCGTNLDQGTHLPSVVDLRQTTGAPPGARPGSLARAETALPHADVIISTDTRISPGVFPTAAREGTSLSISSSM